MMGRDAGLIYYLCGIYGLLTYSLHRSTALHEQYGGTRVIWLLDSPAALHLAQLTAIVAFAGRDQPRLAAVMPLATWAWAGGLLLLVGWDLAASRRLHPWLLATGAMLMLSAHAHYAAAFAIGITCLGLLPGYEESLWGFLKPITIWGQGQKGFDPVAMWVVSYTSSLAMLYSNVALVFAMHGSAAVEVFVFLVITAALITVYARFAMDKRLPSFRLVDERAYGVPPVPCLLFPGLGWLQRAMVTASVGAMPAQPPAPPSP